MIKLVDEKNFIDFQLKSVLLAISQGAKTIEEIASISGGIYPDELKKLLDSLIQTKQILVSSNNTYTLSKLPSVLKIDKTRINSSISLPYPHPHDLDWRFSDKTVDDVVNLLINYGNLFYEKNCLLLGSPSVFLKLAFQNFPNIILLDKNKEIINYINTHISLSSIKCYNYDLLSTYWETSERYNLMFCDPPWYTPHYLAFLKQASYITNIGAYIFLSMLPPNTRPQAINDRWFIFEWAYKLGLHIEKLIPNFLEYDTPIFEQISLKSIGIEINNNWRKGDLIVFRKVFNPDSSIYILIKQNKEEFYNDNEDWESITFRNIFTVKLRGPFDDYMISPKIESIEKDNILKTVSKRYEKRSDVDLWLYDNRVFKIIGKAAYHTALNILKGENFPQNLKKFQKIILI